MLTAKFQKNRYTAVAFLIKYQKSIEYTGTCNKKILKKQKNFSKNAKVLKQTADIIYVIAEKLKIPEVQVYIRTNGKLLL